VATVYWHHDELSGASLTLRLYPLTSGTLANGVSGDTMTEAGDGLFSVAVDEPLVGWHKAYAVEGGSIVASGFVDMSLAAPVVVENVAYDPPTKAELDEAVSGIATEAAAQVVAAIGSRSVTVTSSVLASGKVILVAGDTYGSETGALYPVHHQGLTAGPVVGNLDVHRTP